MTVEDGSTAGAAIIHYLHTGQLFTWVGSVDTLRQWTKTYPYTRAVLQRHLHECPDEARTAEVVAWLLDV